MRQYYMIWLSHKCMATAQQQKDSINWDDITCGVTLLSRTEKLRKLLHSIDRSPITNVVVSDDGDADARHDLYYSNDWDFELNVVRLTDGSGVGYGRNRALDYVDTDNFLLVDADHQIPENVGELKRILDADDSIGAVGGLLREANGIGGSGTNYHLLKRGEKRYLQLDVQEAPIPKTIAGHLFFEFDKIPNASLFRTAVFDDGMWDPEYNVGSEHRDFYLSHVTDNWRYGITPSVLFPHSIDETAAYQRMRFSPTANNESATYFREKWGIEQVIVGNHWPSMGGGKPRWFRQLDTTYPHVTKSLVQAKNGVQSLLTR